jgi:hypothetical protein
MVLTKDGVSEIYNDLLNHYANQYLFEDENEYFGFWNMFFELMS